MTQTTSTQKTLPTSDDAGFAYQESFLALYRALHGKIDVPKAVRLGDLCVGLAVRRFDQFVDERDQLFDELFGNASDEIKELARNYMHQATQYGRVHGADLVRARRS